MHQHHHRHWQQAHENGWITHVAQQSDGTFIAWAAPAGTLPLAIDYVEDCLEYAQAAAEFALRRQTAHVSCAGGCPGWSEVQAAHDPQATR